jgi:calcium/calmodulin-dependent protein kinase I
LDSTKRSTAEEALQHKWLTGKNASDVDLFGDIVEHFNARKTFRKAVGTVQAANRFKKKNDDNSTNNDAPRFSSDFEEYYDDDDDIDVDSNENQYDDLIIEESYEDNQKIAIV